MLAERVSAKIEDGDIREAIRVAAGDDTMDAHNEATLATTQLQHPSQLSSNLDAERSADSVCDPLASRRPSRTYQIAQRELLTNCDLNILKR
jgi:hypothetical protein